MRFSSPFQKLLRCMAALLIAAVAMMPALTAGVRSAGVLSSVLPSGRGIYDRMQGDGKLYEAEVTLSLEELKAQEESEEYIPHVWPVRFSDHGYISSYYGTRIDPITGEGSEFHGGIDLADKLNTKIHASASGVVTEAEESSGYGLYILIDHGNGYQSRYSHCNSLLVSVGDEVRQGQIIATMGATGRVTGVHCDFRIYLDGAAIDPLTVLDPLDE